MKKPILKGRNSGKIRRGFGKKEGKNINPKSEI
jgi:hypothetical protein